MGLFGKKRDSEPPVSRSTAIGGSYASSRSLPEPDKDWTDPSSVRGEWVSQLQGEEEGLLGWRNGTRMAHEGVVPGQTLNAAEYITRGLAYHLFTPVLSDADALVACRQVLTLIDQVPAEPEWLAEFGPRLSRLALTVVREKHWQPAQLGGDGSVTAEILDARPDGLVVYSARCPGVSDAQTWQHFFQAS